MCIYIERERETHTHVICVYIYIYTYVYREREIFNNGKVNTARSVNKVNLEPPDLRKPRGSPPQAFRFLILKIGRTSNFTN